jgi:hypothetical protein
MVGEHLRACMSVRRLQGLSGVLLALWGLVGAVAPRRLLDIETRVWLCGFENVGDLEPRPWLVEATRTASVATLVAGLVTVALAAAREAGAVEDDASTDGP